mmetsp:Transcript_44985/g.51688  ORF Transcript_44985/g.51688 Transcript_44985/m.51688 type:complete len:96 (+) Transcript_44985:1-288(+)
MVDKEANKVMVDKEANKATVVSRVAKDIIKEIIKVVSKDTEAKGTIKEEALLKDKIEVPSAHRPIHIYIIVDLLSISSWRSPRSYFRRFDNLKGA